MDDPRRKIERLRKGAAASSTLAGTNAGPEPPLERLDPDMMDDNEFDKFWDILTAHAKREAARKHRRRP